MPEVFFLDAADGGQRFCIHHAVPQPQAHLLYIHPFAEEMNKARRMGALQCRAFNSAGFSVLQLDLAGCGDSSGDFGDASWQTWLADIEQAWTWMQERHPQTPTWLWGLRAGCLLASQSAHLLPGVAGQLWWQPPASGQLLVQQWLRLKAAGEMLSGGAKGVVEQLRKHLQQGQAVEIAGYKCAPALLNGMQAAKLSAPPVGSKLAWLELSRTEPPLLMPVSSNMLEAWRASDVHAQALPGPAFWQTTEIELAPALIEHSVAWLGEATA